ncbi:hypothetical protein GCM10022207_93870 [Streptomyces lannensis]|uniref:Uncharacterized protein n=1 Tax=Streptomyces lannensis TaxID=766498 RepID=A0ABP7LXZ2_9ACTN
MAPVSTSQKLAGSNPAECAQLSDPLGSFRGVSDINATGNDSLFSIQLRLALRIFDTVGESESVVQVSSA